MPRLPQFGAPPPSLPRRASPADFGAQSAAAGASLARPLEIVGEITTQLEIGRANAQAAKARAQYGADLEDLSRRLPDSAEPPENWEKLFTEGARNLREQQREGLLGGARTQFEQDAEIAAQRQLVLLRDQARGKRRELIQEDTDGALQILGDRAGRAQGSELDRLRGEMAQAVAASVASGAYSQEEGRLLLRSAEKQVSTAHLLRELRTNPQGAFVDLLDSQSPLARGMSEVERQQAIDQAATEFFQQQGRERAAVGFRQSQADRAEREIQEQADLQALDFIEKGDVEGLQGFLGTPLGQQLTRERREAYLKAIENGGRIGGSETNPQAWSEISGLAARGKITRDEIDRAFFAGDLTKTDRDAALRLSEQRRAGDAMDHLKRALDVSENAVGSARFLAQNRAAQAIRELTEFVIENPDQTRSVYFRKADQLIRDAAIVDLQQIEAAQLSPSYAIRKPGQPIDVTDTRARTEEAFESGEIDESEYQEQLGRIDMIEAAQDALARPKDPGKVEKP